MAQAEIVASSDELSISGDINFSTAVSLFEKSLPLLETFQAIHFNFEKVTSANSAGLALLIEWMKYGKEKQKSVTFRNLPSTLKSVAGVAGVVI